MPASQLRRLTRESWRELNNSRTKWCNRPNTVGVLAGKARAPRAFPVKGFERIRCRIEYLKTLKTPEGLEVPCFRARHGLRFGFPLEGAERSFVKPTRRKRGLRKGRCRSRGCQPRRTTPTGPLTTAPSSRKVNHSGRKFIWAVKASNALRRDCEKLNKLSKVRHRGVFGLDGNLVPSHAEQARRKMKLHCLAKWTRLHKQATLSGIPEVAAFHSSFWKYLLVETSRGDLSAQEGFSFILAGLDTSGDAPEQVIVEGGKYRKKPVFVGRSSLASTRKRTCRRCGYIGSDHDWDGCTVRLGAPPKAKKGGGPLRRR